MWLHATGQGAVAPPGAPPNAFVQRAVASSQHLLVHGALSGGVFRAECVENEKRKDGEARKQAAAQAAKKRRLEDLRPRLVWLGVPAQDLDNAQHRIGKDLERRPGNSRGTADVRWCRSQPAAHVGFSALGAPRRGGTLRPALAQTHGGS